MGNGVRSRLLAFLSPRTIWRVSIDLGTGVGIAVVLGLWNAIARDEGMSWTALPGSIVRGVVITAFAIGLPGLAGHNCSRFGSRCAEG